MTWRKDDYTQDDTIVIYDENGGTVVIIRGDGRLTERQRRQADMIVAVPDLIEACERVINEYKAKTKWNEPTVTDQCRAAIAKARGE